MVDNVVDMANDGEQWLSLTKIRNKMILFIGIDNQEDGLSFMGFQGEG